MLNFFLGMMFIYICLPILESLMSVICTELEVLKAKCNIKITEYNNKITQINSKIESSAIHPIGFQYNSKEKSEENYED